MNNFYIMTIMTIACVATSSTFAMSPQTQVAAVQKNIQREAQARLFGAIKKGDLAGMRAAFAQGANGSDVYANFDTPIRFAFMQTQQLSNQLRNEIIALLIQHGGTVHDLDVYLPGYAESGDIEKVEWLLQQGARNVEAFAAVNRGKEYADQEALAKYSRITALLQQHQ